MFKALMEYLTDDKISMSKEMTKYFQLSMQHGLDLKLVQDNTKRIKSNSILLFYI